jgi:hypothetical protein
MSILANISSRWDLFSRKCNHMAPVDLLKFTNLKKHRKILIIVTLRWVDNIKMNLREIGWDGVDWIDMAQDRDQWRALVNTVLNLRVP